MRVLITGHKGFIGSNVYLDWQEQLGSVNVDGIDRPDDVSSFSGGDYDLVVHLAAYANIRDSLENPQLFYENNVVKAKPLFDWCQETILDFSMRLLVQQKKTIGKTHMQ